MGKVLEADVEAYLRDEARARGWDSRKYINDTRRGGTAGTPDRIVTATQGLVAWVEVKRPGTIKKYLQKRLAFMRTGDVTGCTATEIRQFTEQQKLEDLGQLVYVAGSCEDVDAILDFIGAHCE